MRLYKHVLQVIVITPEESPDAVVAALESTQPLSQPDASRITAHVDPANRMTGPCVTVPDSPEFPDDAALMEKYYTDLDAWRDQLPRTADVFDALHVRQRGLDQ